MIDKPVAIITGTSKGIGKYQADYYSKSNYFVISFSRNELEFKLENYKHYCLDVCDENSLRKVSSDFRKEYGRSDVLVNNAAVDYTLQPILIVPYKSALKTIEINIMGTFLFIREAIKLMKKNLL